MTAPPPSRYRVEERGRTLVVVDTWASGARPVSVPPARVSQGAANEGGAQAGRAKAHQPAGGGFGLRRASFTDRELSTLSLFDAKGPRRIRIVAGSPTLTLAKRVLAGGLVALAVVTWLFGPVALMMAATVSLAGYRQLRPAVTHWLDLLENESS